ncbi:BrnT family toxin [soil metagenome]
MKFEWDENKRRINLKRHGFNFQDVIGIFDDPNALTILDDRFDYGEIRFVTFGLLKNVLVSIVHTEDDKIIRIISVRKAEKDEEIEYYKQIGN